MSDISLADVEVTINKAFKEWVPTIIAECTKNNQLFQAECDAHRIFKDRDNVKNFYNTQDDLEQHIEMHKTNEIQSEKRQGFIIKILTSSVVLQSIWSFFQWKQH